MKRSTSLLSILGLLCLVPASRGADLPLVEGVDLQPLSAQARRVVEALDQLGAPLPNDVTARLESAAGAANEAQGIKAIQQALDPFCLIGVDINPESRVKSARGPAEARLMQHGWRPYLIKVHNEAGVTAELKAESPNAQRLVKPSSGSPEPKLTIPPAEVRRRWIDVATFSDRPMNKPLSGLALEYRILLVYSRDLGPREARVGFNVGQGTQDLGFRSDVDILFDCAPAVPVTLEVLDDDGTPAVGSFQFRDGLHRVYPAQARRLAPDLYFHPQIYRASGETVLLPPGTYTVQYTRGPEYLVKTKSITVPDAKSHKESFRLERWADLAKMRWFSGDHHVHAAGCGHYESPTEGVRPEDMMRHILGEDLDVGCMLSWGPCWYYQKQFFEGKVSGLSTPKHLMRYDVEVSGFPSSHAGHLCLLRLKEDDYPGTTRIEEWPSWDLPVLQWGKKQGGVVGFSHSGWGLLTKDMTVPTLEVPPFDGIGANEYIVDVTHDAVDFISAVDTPAPSELTIWYHTLNCGYQARISGETDFPCIYGERVGLGRSYVRLADGPLDFDRWAEGIKQGRSYVSDGSSHLADFRVEDIRVGEGHINLAAPRTVTVHARVGAWLDPKPSAGGKLIRSRSLVEKPYWNLERARIGDSRKVPLEVVVNGKAVARVEVEADGTFRDVALQVPIDRSSWVALRVYPSSHTNPVWVGVGGKPVRASKASAEWCLKSVDQCWSQKEKNIRPAERDAARKAYEHAREAYRKVLAESAGD